LFKLPYLGEDICHLTPGETWGKIGTQMRHQF